MANLMKLTQGAWDRIHDDFKATIDGCKFRMWGGKLVAVQIVDKYDFKQGDRVRCNGYEGAIIRHYTGNMYEVRLDRGGVCVDASELVSM